MVLPTRCKSNLAPLFKRSTCKNDMKQHITKEQLGELSRKGKEKLRKWWEIKEGDRVYVLDKNGWEKRGYGGYPDFDEIFSIESMFTKDDIKFNIEEKKKYRIEQKDEEGRYEFWTKEIDKLKKRDCPLIPNDCSEGEYGAWIEKKYCLPLLSIGQMIEFLDDDWVPYEGSKCFCDSLWKLVKEELEKTV